MKSKLAGLLAYDEVKKGLNYVKVLPHDDHFTAYDQRYL